MPVKKIYKRTRDGLIFADVGKVHNKLFLQMVKADHSDKTKFLRFLIEQEAERRKLLPVVVGEIGGEVEGAETVSVWGVV